MATLKRLTQKLSAHGYVLCCVCGTFHQNPPDGFYFRIEGQTIHAHCWDGEAGKYQFLIKNPLREIRITELGLFFSNRTEIVL